MAPKILFGLLTFLFLLVSSTAFSFTFHGFNESNITLEEKAKIDKQGRLELTRRENNIVGHAFYNESIKILDKNTSVPKPKVFSFSTFFVFSIVSPSSGPGGFGLAFTIAPSTQFPQAEGGHLLGLFNSSNDMNSSNQILVVEFDTVNGYKDATDTVGNHVGVNKNGMSSNISEPAAYFEDGKKEEFNMEMADAVCVWIEYDGETDILNLTIASYPKSKPSKPLISQRVGLESVMKESMFFGFSASTGKRKSSAHYILGWSFAVNGVAPQLDYALLPKPPPKEKHSNTFPWIKVVIGILSALTFTLLCLLLFVTLYKRYMVFETLEDWEMDCPHRFRYRDLHLATKGFTESQLIGVGGFGSVYKGVLPSTGSEVAVKRILRTPAKGMREFAAEIESLGRLRHKNLVNLQGWCKHKNDLLLVYDYIPNGSLDSLLFSKSFVLDWDQRFRILKGVAAGLLYLHEEWEQVVIHRDVKSSNILIDGDFNAHLGDFGLARLYSHDQVSHTTSVVGTIGYIAPELTRTGKASTSSDVYAFGVLLLEMVAGTRPVGSSGNFFLVDWVLENSHLGQILEVVDPKLDSVYDEEEAELVLKLGLLCTQNKAEYRPSIQQVTRYLNFDDPFPDISDCRYYDSQSSTTSLGFSKAMSTGEISSSSYSLPSIDRSTISIEAGR
ncbi:lectin-domain containing receptor kinase VI.4-like [Vigna unguiculata]|uniref:non-specific serine/threonine protein kinase n=1 Tax=Vigna unguiculata TaxID=3917 RepID=A0A4D6MRP8_VIGUN|nr:lectin-domain containing receptor kinase VI.4-like [Vigna unguiculata]QCE03311.1 somatic embryogenesis receptor kinase 4 [Vigna unguiculata]